MRTIDADAFKDYIRGACEDMKHLYKDNGAWAKLITESFCKDIDEQPTVFAEPHWIPVEQALPELRHDVLLTVFFHERWNVAEGYRQDGEFMFWNNGRLDSVLDEENRVIAWMPKPEPARR